MSLLSGPHEWIRMLVAFVAAGVLGFGAGIEFQDRATADIVPSDLNLYTYNNGLCQVGGEIDPINVVFTNYGFAPEITQQADDHGGWGNHSGGTQYFGDQYGCFIMENQSAGNPGLFAGRYHMRYYNHRGLAGGLRIVSNFGSISSADAHHEDTVLCGHAIDDDSESFTIAGVTGGGGFNRGREDVRKNWVVNADHVLEAAHYWGNTMVMEQCNDNMASSDGWVYYIRTFDATADTDLDGCTTEQELQSGLGSETTGGFRDPSYFWDFFDPNRDKSVAFGDFIQILNRFNTSGIPPVITKAVVNADPPPLGTYWVLADRGGQIQGGDPWDELPADGAIGMGDFLSILRQFGHSCG